MIDRTKKFIVIASPTFICNASCSHCGIPSDIDYKKILSPEELYISIKNVLTSFYKQYLDNYEIHFVFHGGEPMILGIDYIEKFIRLTEKENYQYFMQSNMILYDKKWRDIFKKYDFKVSTSYDFYGDIRRLKTGEDYYKTWSKNVKQYIQDTGRRIQTIVTLNRKNINYIEEMIDIANELNINLELNCIRPTGRALKNHSNNFITPGEYGFAMAKAYTYGKKYQDMKVRYGHTIEKIVSENTSLPCPFTRNCIDTIFMIDSNGNMHKCPIAMQYSFPHFGNALSNQLDMKRFIKFKTLTSYSVEDCNGCNICNNGGCPIDRISGDIFLRERNTYCVSYRILYESVLKLNRLEIKEVINI